MARSDEPIYVLSENEEIIRAWTYAVDNKNRGEHELVVTNKRIISIDRHRYANGTRTDRQELRNGDISSLSCSAGVQTHFVAAFICCIIAIISLVRTIIGTVSEGEFNIYIIIMAVITVLFLVLAILFFTRKRTMLNLALYTDTRNNYALSLGASMGLKLRARRRGKVKIKVDPAIAGEIVSTIGAILLTNDRR